MDELSFESDLIQYITSGKVTSPEMGTTTSVINEKAKDYIVKTKLWQYVP